MPLSEDLSVFLSDFGVSVTAGPVSGLGILDMPTQVIADGQVLSTDYALTCRADQFGNLLYGDAVTVGGVAYSVRETRRLDDGAFVEVALMKLAPDAVAPGGNPAGFGLGDLADVELATPTTGEVLQYDGTRWVDAPPGSVGTTYVHNQATPATVWTINHNLGYRPAVELFDAGGNEFDADIVHTSVNQVVVHLNIAATGTARLN